MCNIYIERLLDAAVCTTRSFYEACLGRPFTSPASTKAILELTSGVQSSGIKINPKGLRVQELDHPLRIMLAAYSLAREHAVDSVIGFPSGGTQMAITTAVACEILHELCPRTVNVICVSLSQHSGTTKEGATPISDECLDASIDVSADSIRGKRVIIVDDNSSTGSTISRGMRAIQKLSPTFIACGVGEIDPQRALIRARKAASEEKILGVADMRHELFEGAMGIVPVSGRDIQLRKEYAGRVLGTISGTSKV